MKVFCAEFSALAALLILLGCAVSTHAADGATILEPVTVTGVAEDRISGSSRLAAEQLEALPQGDGNLNDLLIVLPGVQAGEMTNTSLQGGEISPPLLSISGGKVYDNNFLLDGMGINNQLDPMYGSSTNSGLFLPSSPQTMVIDTSLVSRVTVYDNNVPAEFSGFSGGVVSADTISPGAEFGGKLRYRTTRNEWTEFHVEDEESFSDSNSASMQPKFTKQDAGITLNVPLTDQMGLVASYSILNSDLHLTHLGETKDQLRRRENLFLKYEVDLTERDVLTLTAAFQPEEGEYFYPDSYASDYTVERMIYNYQAGYKHYFSLGELELKAGFLQSDSERNAPPHLYIWKVSPSKPWGELVDSTSSREGMVGSLEESQQDYQLKGKFSFAPVRTGRLEHTVKIGADYERIRGSHERDADSYNFYSPMSSATVVCNEGAIDCIDGEQYFTRRVVFQEASVVEDIDQYNVYFEDLIRWMRLELRPGLNVGYNDFMKNSDYAPRLAGSYDLFGNGSTVAIAGWNRYYGKTLLAYKLREAGRPTLNQKLNVATGEWETLTYGPGYLYSRLKTPYTDELVLGVDQRMLGGTVKLRYVKRDGEDQFASQKDTEPREDGAKYVSLNNNGSSRYEAYSAEWERRWGRHYLAVNGTYQESTTSNEGYDDALDGLDLVETCWFDGRSYACSELPRRDYNRPWEANLVYSVKLPYNFTFTNHTKYRSGYVGLDALTSSERTTQGVPEEVAMAYQEEKQPESWIFNWKLDWRRNLYRNHGLQISLEINNVFNQKVPAGAAEEIQTYELGRQFWAGMEYYF
ncbi:TonB-dependent receptor plug domain-containing protein [Desulfuromonas acetexigens]|nr:TonB-dependent receptor plug domain-containing protein [Desulfuromonas acetexigens]